MAKSTCSVDGCDRPSRSWGWCAKHYKQWWRATHRGPVCSIEGCDSPAFCRSWCTTHYERWHRNGDPLVLKPRLGRRPPTATQRERARASKKKYRDANRERLRAAGRAYYAADPIRQREATKAWVASNPDVPRKHVADRRARISGAFVESVDSAVVYERDKGVCQICGEPIGKAKWHVDHIYPLVRGGEHSYENVQLAHARCNIVKGAKVA